MTSFDWYLKPTASILLPQPQSPLPPLTQSKWTTGWAMFHPSPHMLVTPATPSDGDDDVQMVEDPPDTIRAPRQGLAASSSLPPPAVQIVPATPHASQEADMLGQSRPSLPPTSIDMPEVQKVGPPCSRSQMPSGLSPSSTSALAPGPTTWARSHSKSPM